MEAGLTCVTTAQLSSHTNAHKSSQQLSLQLATSEHRSAYAPYPALETPFPGLTQAVVEGSGIGSPCQYLPTRGSSSARAPPLAMHEYLMPNVSAMPMQKSSSARPPASAEAALSAQKRTRRGRRKDPSCDGCRERKVKCDAANMSSCSECMRKCIKCQFTRETKRRMSSIKRVQDLEKQLASAKQQISIMITSAQGHNSTKLVDSLATVSSSTIPHLVIQEPDAQLPIVSNSNGVQQNLRDHGRGIFTPPHPYLRNGPPAKYSHDETPLPSKHIADRLLSQYHESVHLYAPHLHWPSFQHECHDLYRAGTLKGVSCTWVALFFAVLACGTLIDLPGSSTAPETQGAKFLQSSLRSINLTSNYLSLHHVRVSLLFSIYYMEMNVRSTGRLWLAAAMDAAQDLGLHIDHGHYGAFEAEIRKRTWWSLYTWDRMVSLETGRPLHITDEDCEVGQPIPVGDALIQLNGTIMQPSSPPAPNNMTAIIPVVYITASIKKTLQSRKITAATLNTYDNHFKDIMSSYPVIFTTRSTDTLEPRLLHAACTLQTSRFLLYRHNLSPACCWSERHDALDRLVFVGRDTATYVQRSFIPADMGSWAVQLRTLASAFLCTHIWRCILALSFRAEYSDALTLVQVSAAVGDLRQDNMACGRYLNFFLEKLVERLHAGTTKQQLDNDEEMLAYVSADMQGNAESAWAWTDSRSNPTSSRSTEMPFNAKNQLTNDCLRDWPGWGHIQRVLARLLHEQQQRHQPRAPLPLFAAPPKCPPTSASAPPLLPLPRQNPQQQRHPWDLVPAPLQRDSNVSLAPRDLPSHSSGNEKRSEGAIGEDRGGSGSRIRIKDIM